MKSLKLALLSLCIGTLAVAAPDDKCGCSSKPKPPAAKPAPAKDMPKPGPKK